MEKPHPAHKCQHYVERKKRWCRFDALPGTRYCGNHYVCGEGLAEERVVCPFDPKASHTVLLSKLEKHKKTCPAYQLMLQHKAQPFYSQGINDGPGPGAGLPEAPLEFAHRGRTDTAAARRAAYAASLGPERFARLLERVEAAYQQLCREPEVVSVLRPAEAEPYLQLQEDSLRPFSLKHAMQQASIVGNMQQAGLLGAEAGATTYVEFGAGKGYLSSMLADCSAARRLVMMDVRGFQKKADRSMRHLEMQRLRCDIRDFDPCRVPGLEGGAAPWVGIGKHLCGAATDFTLRCCARERRRSGTADSKQQGQEEEEEEEEAGAQLQREAQQQQGQEEGPQQQQGPQPDGVPATGLRGLAVATCCHHRCDWQHYVGQESIAASGFSPQEFEVISWMTGWALCGHEAPAGFGAEEGEGAGSDGEEAGGSAQEQAAAAADALPGRGDAEQRHDYEAGEGAAAVEGDGDGRERSPAAWQNGQAPAKRQHLEPPQGSSAGSQQQQQQQQQAAAGGEVQQGPAGVWPRAWRPYHSLSRAQRVAVGQKCKRLIDAGRLQWLRGQGFQVRIVTYVPPEVSGENQLVLAT